MKPDLETLRRVKFIFDIHSDHSSRCNGYRSLCDLIEKTEKYDSLPITMMEESADELIRVVWGKGEKVSSGIDSNVDNMRSGFIAGWKAKEATLNNKGSDAVEKLKDALQNLIDAVPKQTDDADWWDDDLTDAVREAKELLK